MSHLVSIIIVNYNSGDYLPRCLASVFAQTWQDFEVIVVDNASSDDSMRHLDAYPQVMRIANAENRGFAAAQNQGMRAARSRYLMPLNFDIVLTESFLSEIVSSLEVSPGAGWACGKLHQMDPDGTPRETLYAVGHDLPLNRAAELRGYGEKDSGQYDTAITVFGAPGAAALYCRQMIDDISMDGQFFDERLFTWYEDVDVDWRANLRGWKCLYVPTAVGYHAGHVGEEYPEPFRSFRAETCIRNRWLLIAADETFRSFVRAALHVLAYELSLLLYVVRVGLVHAYLRAARQFLGSLSYIRAKRAQVHRRRS